MTALALPGRVQIGAFIKHGSQRFECVGFEQTTRTDGTSVTVAIWATECPSCGVSFTQTASAEGGGQVSRRRCPEHVAQGRKVKPA